jgi:hypothetical protein
VLISDAIVRGVRIVARSPGILPPAATRPARLDVDRFAPADWLELDAAGAVGHLRVLNQDVAERLGAAAKAVDGNPAAAPDAVLVDFYAALLTPTGIATSAAKSGTTNTPPAAASTIRSCCWLGAALQPQPQPQSGREQSPCRPIRRIIWPR